MRRAWVDFLRGSELPGHAAQVYEDREELADSVVSYLSSGFQIGEPAIVVATRENFGLLATRLVASGWSVRDLDEQGLLVVADAGSTLQTIMRKNRPSQIAFEAVVGTLLDQLAQRFPGRRTRVFGEMVNLLCERGQTDAAIELEEFWNDLAQHRPFSLLCGYRLNVFDHASQVGPLPAVCHLHSHVLIAPDDARLGRAVGRAFEDVLGQAQAGQVYLLIGEQARQERVPVSQLAMMWVSANMPVLAERVLAVARAYYSAQPAPAASI